MPETADRLLRLLLGEEPERVPAPSPGAWERVARLALDHGLGPLLHRRIRASPLAPDVPVGVLRALEDARFHNELRMEAGREALGEILRALREAGIGVVALKGAHLAELVYEEPGLRPMCDIDLLVRPHELARATRVLADRGYRVPAALRERDYSVEKHAAPRVRAGALPIELHHRLERPGSTVHLPVDAFRERSRPARIAGVRVRVLCPEDLLIHLCAHLAHNHRFEGSLLSLWDVAEVYRRHGAEIDPAAVARTATEAGAAGPVGLALSLARRHAGAPVPADLTERLLEGQDGAPPLEAAFDGLTLPRADALPWVCRAAVRQPGLRSRIRVLARALFPSPGRIRAERGLPPGSPWAYAWYLVAPVDFLRRRGRSLLEMLRGRGRAADALSRERRLREVREWLAGAA